MTTKSTVVNLTNHPSNGWTKAQQKNLKNVTRCNKILDCQFPAIGPNWSSQTVKTIANGYACLLHSGGFKAVMLQGENTFVRALNEALNARGIPTYAASCEKEDGKTQFTNHRKYWFMSSEDLKILDELKFTVLKEGGGLMLNATSHPSYCWEDNLITNINALKVSGVVDVGFPIINSKSTSKEIHAKAINELVRISKMGIPITGILCQGESIYTNSFVDGCKYLGIPIYAATNKRSKNEDFEFVSLRRY